MSYEHELIMLKKLTLYLVIFCCTKIVRAQESTPVASDTIEIAIAEEELLYKEDTTGFAFYELPTEVEYIPGDDLPAIVKDKLQCIQQTIPLIYNERVHSFINYFTVRDREYTRMVATRKNLYFPLFEKYLAKYGLPDELKYLAIIESGLNPKAVSRARAVGLWQFMSPTGRHYGLNHDWYIDDRMDPEKSTDAACRYLRDLYGMFHNWELALASYNAGPGNVKKAIRRSGYKKSFWEVYNYLPRETRSYVPQFVAIIYTMNYLDDHNFYNVGQELMMPHDTLMVNKFLHFNTFANLTGICLEDLQRLNPSIQRNAIPQINRKYTLKIPQVAKDNLMINRLAILDSASKIGKQELEVLAKNTAGSTYGRDRVMYRVKSGDVLGSIAMRYHVRVDDIRKWNNLNGNTIHVGQRLNIWLKQPVGNTAAIAAAPAKQVVPVPIPNSKTYVVQYGDTLWDISRKFEGLTIEKIKQLNNLANSKIQPGQKLVIAL
jgi:membrane-bound lytic murein transglycosylase D